MAVAEQSRVPRQSATDGRERFIRAGRGHAISLGEQAFLQRFRAAGPLGDFQTRRELRLHFINGMGEETRQERGAARALHELRRAREKAEHETEDGRVGNVPGRDVNKQFRPARQSCGVRAALAGEAVEPLGVAEVLGDERVEIFGREGFEERIESARQSHFAETGFNHASFERQFAKGIVRLQPALRRGREDADDARRRATQQILLAVALQSLARLGHQRWRDGVVGGQVRDEVIGEVHLMAVGAG